MLMAWYKVRLVVDVYSGCTGAFHNLSALLQCSEVMERIDLVAGRVWQ